MKFVILFLLAIGFISCKKVSDIKNVDRVEENDNFKEITIEGCQYIIYEKGYSDNKVFSITHKGNCENHK